MASVTDDFPLVRISGGPRAKNMQITIDGVPIRRLQKFILRGSINDMMLLYTRQIVRVEAGVVTATEEQDAQG